MLELTSDALIALTNAREHVTSNIASELSLASNTQTFSLLTGPNDVVRYDVTKFPALLSEHLMSFQAFCRYVIYFETKTWTSLTEKKMFATYISHGGEGCHVVTAAVWLSERLAGPVTRQDPVRDTHSVTLQPANTQRKYGYIPLEKSNKIRPVWPIFHAVLTQDKEQ